MGNERRANIWTAVAKRSDAAVFQASKGFENGVALCFPPQSKPCDCGTSRTGDLDI
jgi:hypothetical protein